MEPFLVLLLVAGISIAAAWDLKTQKIPNLITYPMMVFGLLLHGISSGFSGLLFSGAGLLAGIGFFLIPYLLGGMGAGDAKLMGGVGAMLGTAGVVVAAVASVLIGLVYAIVLLTIHRDYAGSFLKRSWIMLKIFFLTRQWVPIPCGSNEKQPVLSYALPIALGTLCTVLLKSASSNLIHQLVGLQLSI